MQMNTEWYRIFLSVARLGNLTKAAQELHLTQPSVSYAVKQLEAGLGVALFDRLSKGVRLTREGEALLDYVEQSFSFLAAGERHLRSLKELTAGELRVGASGPVIKHLLLPPLDRFHAEHPGIRIRLSQGKSSELRQRLLEGEIDFGLVHLPFADPGLDVLPLIDIQDCFVVGPAYGRLAEKPFDAAAIENTPLLLLSEGSSTRRFVERWLASQGVTAEADMELSSMDMLVELAERGYGAAFVTEAFVREELRSGRLLRLSTAEPIPPRSVGIATRRGASLPVIAERFLGMLRPSL